MINNILKFILTIPAVFFIILVPLNIIHEFFHKLAIIITSKLFKLNYTHITINITLCKSSCVTRSDFYEMLSARRYDPKIQTVIRINAIFGFLGELISMLILLFILYIFKFNIIFASCCICVFLRVFHFFKSSDFKYLCHPETFIYKYK